MLLQPVEPACLLHVRRDGHWWPGELRAWLQLETSWQGYVTYTVAVGMRHLSWVDQDRLRPG